VQTYAPLIQQDLKTETQHELNDVIRLNTVEFTSGAATLTPAGRRSLDQIVPILAALPAMPCEIQGYTDSSGDGQQDMDLSDRRAHAVQDYLVSKGISAARLDAEGYGENNPIAPNDTEENRRKNRRIEFLLKEDLRK
jgi:OOP family OmpA-OmpF porin